MKRLANEGASKEPKGIHLFVNNAGIARDDNTRFSKAGKPDFSSARAISEHFMQSEPDKWSETFQTNLTTQFLTTRAFLPLLARERREGYARLFVPSRQCGFNLWHHEGNDPRTVRMCYVESWFVHQSQSPSMIKRLQDLFTQPE